MKTPLFFLLLSLPVLAQDFLPASLSLNFEETKKSVIGGKEKKTFGRVDYKFPRQIRYEVLTPEDDRVTFVSNAKTSWLYTPPFMEGEEGQVNVQGAELLPLSKFLDTLKNGLKTNPKYAVSFKGPKAFIKPGAELKKELQMEEAILTTKSGSAEAAKSLAEFGELDLNYSNKQKVNMKFSDFKAGASFSDAHFVFVIPPKTKVTQGK